MNADNLLPTAEDQNQYMKQRTGSYVEGSEYDETKYADGKTKNISYMQEHGYSENSKSIHSNELMNAI